MVARKGSPVNRASKKKGGKKPSKRGSSKRVPAPGPPRTKKTSKKKSNTRIKTAKKPIKLTAEEKRQVRSAAAKQGWAKRKLREKAEQVKRFNAEIKKGRKQSKTLKDINEAKLSLAVATTPKIKKKLKQILKKSAEEFKSDVVKKLEKEGMIETEESKLQRYLAEAYYLSITNVGALNDYMYVIMDEFDISESEAWYLFRINYNEDA